MTTSSRVSKANIEIYNQQIDRFRKRSDGLRIQAWVALFLIMMMLISAVLIFIFASEIAKKDVSNEEEVALTEQYNQEKIVEAELDTVFKLRNYDMQHEDLLSDIVALRDGLEKKVSEKVGFYANSLKLRAEETRKINTQAFVFDVASEFKKPLPTYLDIPRPLTSFVKSDQAKPIDITDMFEPVALGIIEDEVMRLLASDNELFVDVQKIFSEGSKTSMQIKDLLDLATSDFGKIVESRKRSVGIQEDLTELRKNNEDAENGGDITSSMTLLIQTNITRFGPVIFFFVTILINLYRYSIRLSAYYEARADALFILQSGIDSEKFDALVGALTPDNHDVGKAPKVPTDYVVDLAKTAVSKIPSGK